MGYASQTPSALPHLREKVQAALIAAAVPLLDSGNPTLKLMAQEIVKSPGRLIEDLTLILMVTRAVTVESTDADLDTAIGHADTIQALQEMLGIAA